MSNKVSSESGPQRRMTAEARRTIIERAATEVFAEHGYHGASMDAIALRSGVSVPVLYDHFASKQDLHRRLLELHFAELRAIWTTQLASDASSQRRLAEAIGAWYAYVEAHPYAWRMLFRETTGDPEVAAIHREVAARSRDALLPLLARELGAAADSHVALEMFWEVVRGALQGLALWWYEHPDVPRDAVVATAMNALWIGMERVGGGETWHSGA